MPKEPGWLEQSSQMQRQWLQQPTWQEPERTQSIWMLRHTIILHLTCQLQNQSVVPISLVFNVDLGTISERTVPTTVALTATGQPLIKTNWFVQSESMDYAKRRGTSLPTALSTMIGTIIMSSRMRDILGTESVTQSNEGGSVTVFLSLLSSAYGLTISPSTYGYNVTWLPMWLTLTHLISDSLWLGCYSTSRQLSLGAVPHVPTHPFMDALVLVLLAQHGLCTDLYSI